MKRLLFLTALVLGPVLAGCHKETTSNPAPESPVVAVRVQRVERQPITTTEDVVGTVRPKLSAAIEAKVSGRIEKMLVVPGQTVKTGELLVQLDAREIQARYDQTLAARQQAESDLKRLTELLNQKILSQAEFEAAQARFRVSAATELEARTMLDYIKILAPFDGVITRKLADVGDLAMPGKPLLQMENPAALRFEADVPEALVDNVKLGQKLMVHIDSVSSQITGTVVEISPAADSSSRTFLVKLDLPDASGLRSGQFGRVAVPVGTGNAIRVPASAVVQRGQMEMVFVVADGRAQLRLVKTGRHAGEEVEIASGLNSGENIVTDGAGGLTDGQPLSIQP